MNAQAQKLADKLNRKRDTIARLRDKGGFYRKSGSYDEYNDDFLTARGRQLITDAYFLIHAFTEIDGEDIRADNYMAAWDWYCKTYNDGVWFDADDLAA